MISGFGMRALGAGISATGFGFWNNGFVGSGGIGTAASFCFLISDSLQIVYWQAFTCTVFGCFLSSKHDNIFLLQKENNNLQRKSWRFLKLYFKVRN